jgi:hypothetical protein
MSSQNVEYEPILALFRGFEPGSYDLDPDLQQGEKSDPNQNKKSEPGPASG